MSQNLGSLPPLSHNVTLSRPPPPPLTCDVIYGCHLIYSVSGRHGNLTLEHKLPWKKYNRTRNLKINEVLCHQDHVVDRYFNLVLVPCMSFIKLIYQGYWLPYRNAQLWHRGRVTALHAHVPGSIPRRADRCQPSIVRDLGSY